MNRNDLAIFIENINFELDKIRNNEAYINNKSYFGLDKDLLSYIRNLEQALDESEKLINTILNFSFFKEECPLNFNFEDNSKEDKAQNIFYSDEYCENNCNDIYKDCWLKYFKELQKVKGDGK